MSRAGIGMIAATLALAACAPGPARERPERNAALRIEIEEILAPQVFLIDGEARVASVDGPPGLWAAAPGLPRPERGEVLNLATGDTVKVSLFRASGRVISVSRAAAEAIGMVGTAPVRLTAVRSEPRVLSFDRSEGLSYSDQAP